MFPLFECRENVEKYINDMDESWKKKGSPFEGWHKMDIKGPTRQEYIKRLKHNLWDITTPCLGPAMCEIAVKGWHNKKDVENLKQKGYGEDFYRYMAIHLLGELKYKKAAGYLLEILKDNQQDEYLRAHAARALIKIDPGAYAEDFYQMEYVDKTSTKVIRREIKWDAFPEKAVLETVKKLLPGADSFDTETHLLMRLTDCFRKADGDVQKEIVSILKGLLKDQDVRMRLMAQGYLKSFSIPEYTPENYKTKEERLKYVHERYRRNAKYQPLDFHYVYYGERKLNLFKLKQGRLSKEEAEDMRTFYLEVVEYVSGQYTQGNVFATKELHNNEWPVSVQDLQARAFFQKMCRLKRGMTEQEVRKITGPELKEFVRRDLPESNIVYVEYHKDFKQAVEGNFGRKVQKLSVEMVFKKGKLLVVHDPSR
jgi:hypothetical protein